MRQRTLTWLTGLVLAFPLTGAAQTYTLAPNGKFLSTDATGGICASCKLCTYTAGTSTAVSSFSDNAGTANANPLTLDAGGRGTVYLIVGNSYKFELRTAAATSCSTGTVIWTQDNITAVPASTLNLDLTGTAGEALTAAQIVYLSDGSGAKTAGRWYLADADNAYSSTLPVIGVAVAAIASGSAGTIRIDGAVTGLSGLVTGGTYYVSATAGALTATAPAAGRRVGQADSATTLVMATNPTPLRVDGALTQGRLTLTTATCVTTADVTAATTIYFTPGCGGGNQIALYDGTNWQLRTFTELSLAVPATTNTLYDVYVYDNAGVATLELTAWTNDTTRATALVRQNGVWSKTGALTRKFLGVMRTTGVSGQTEDSFAKRYVWNEYNRAPRALRVTETANSWAYTTAAYQQMNNAAANQIDLVVGVADVELSVWVVHHGSSTTVPSAAYCSIGQDAITAHANTVHGVFALDAGGAVHHARASLNLYPAVGRHYYTALEYGGTADTFYGDNNTPTLLQSGIFGTIQG